MRDRRARCVIGMSDAGCAGPAFLFWCEHRFYVVRLRCLDADIGTKKDRSLGAAL